MTDTVKFLIKPLDVVPMDERTAFAAQPEQALFYRLNIDVTQGNIELRYTARSAWTGLSCHQDFEKKMETLIAGNNGNIGNIRPKRTRDTNADQAGRSKDTHLSINFDKMPLSYVILKLSSRHNWQFSASGAPFMMDKKDAGAKRFFEPRRFNSRGKIIENSSNVDGCTFAYFIVNPSNFVMDAQGGFQHRFNIHIDIVEGDETTIDNRIPIIIDPDVRHPGGHGEP